VKQKVVGWGRGRMNVNKLVKLLIMIISQLTKVRDLKREANAVQPVNLGYSHSGTLLRIISHWARPPRRP